MRTKTIDNEVYYYANDIAKELGYAKPRNAIAMHCKNVLKDFIEINNKGLKQTVKANFINKNDVLLLVANAKRPTQQEKQELLVKLNIKESVVLTSRFEIEFFKGLEIVLTQMDINIELQKRILNYKLDGYLPQYNLVIEYDEEQHKYQQEEDKQREKEIKEVLNCDFIRLDYKDNDFINIGKVLNAIIKK